MTSQLDLINAQHEKRHELSNKLLANIKQSLDRVESRFDTFRREEPDLIYRFYHQSFKVFIMCEMIKQTKIFSNSWHLSRNP